MDHPEYRYQPWSAERRQRASAAAKARHATKSADGEVIVAEESFRAKFASAPDDWQYKLMDSFLDLIKTYRRTQDPAFKKMLGQVWVQMARVIDEDLRAQ